MNDQKAPTLRLFVAADSPSSRDAKRNLDAALARLGLPTECLVLIDVFDHPEIAIDAGVIVTPTLEIIRGRRRQLVAGRLASEEDLQKRLAE